MTENEKLDRLKTTFEQLQDEGQQYILAVSQALIFAQDHFAVPTKTVKRKRLKSKGSQEAVADGHIQ